MNTMNLTEVAHPSFHVPSQINQGLVVLLFVVGIVGNTIALIILYDSAKRRNKKHVLMLRWLAVNDLAAAVGMLTVTNMASYNIPVYWLCTSFVILRGFGLGSGIVALIMALERWFALTRPFLYQKLVTYDVLKRTLCCLWLAALLFTYFPLFGFGLFYNEDKKMCVRYIFGETAADKTFAWLNFAVGISICFSIALCNIAVVLELSKIRSQSRVLVRRISRSLIVNNRAGYTRHQQTPEEVAFAKLMAYISVIFCVCWGPQMVTIPLAQFGNTSRGSAIFTQIANSLLAMYFTLDPFVYVLQRYIEKGSLGFSCFRRKASTSSLPTTTTTAAGESMKWNTQESTTLYSD